MALMTELKNPKDVGAGALFIVFGVLFAAGAHYYSMGTAARMGPGFFPLILGGLLTAIGVAVVARGMWTAGTEIAVPRVRPLPFLLLAITLFGALLRPFGLVIATAVLAFVATLAGEQFRLWQRLALAALLALLAAAIFVHVLGLPLRLWPDL